jgi:S1/P1 Nuclease
VTLADADALNAEITATEAAQFATLSIADWATEAHVIARQLAYTKPDGTAVAEDDFLDDAYFTPALDAVKLQLKKAGVLAALIQAAVDRNIASTCSWFYGRSSGALQLWHDIRDSSGSSEAHGPIQQ